jgi:hypothetical protein
LTVHRSFFARANNLAIFVPNRNQWVHKDDCVWESAPGLSQGIVLADQYPTLYTFFVHQIRIPAVTTLTVIEELRTLPNSTAEEVACHMRRRKELIYTLCDFLVRRPDDCWKLRSLENVHVMPVTGIEHGSKAVKCASLNKSYWVFKDRHDYSEAFHGKIWFADFVVWEYPRLEPLNQAIFNVWRGAQHCLSRKVVLDRHLGTQATIDITATAALRSKARYLKRYLFDFHIIGRYVL